MTVIDVQDALASRSCRIPGCADDATSKAQVGRFAHLCDRHYEAERRKMSVAQTGVPAGERSPAKQPALGAYEQRVRALTAAGRELDRAIERHKASRVKLDDALEAWEEAKRALNGRVVEAE